MFTFNFEHLLSQLQLAIHRQTLILVWTTFFQPLVTLILKAFSA